MKNRTGIVRTSVAIAIACASMVTSAQPAMGRTKARTARITQIAPTYPRGASARFFGTQKRTIYYDDTLTDQFELAMSGGVDDAVRLPNGYTTITTCRPHNCPDKAAAILAPNGALVAAGMIGSQCHKRPNDEAQCDNEPSAFVYIRRSEQSGFARGIMERWARDMLTQATNIDGTPTRNRNVSVIAVN